MCIRDRSSSVPAHVEMMGLIGMGNNPMVGATVAVAVSIEEAAKACLLYTSPVLLKKRYGILEQFPNNRNQMLQRKQRCR